MVDQSHEMQEMGTPQRDEETPTATPDEDLNETEANLRLMRDIADEWADALRDLASR